VSLSPKTVLASALLALATAAPAVAQDLAPPPAFHVNASFDTDVTPSSVPGAPDEQGAAPKTHAVGDRPVVLRVDGGLIFCCSNTGFVVGASASVMPPSLKNVEIAAGAGLGRFAGFTLFTISAEGLYDIHVNGHGAMPFVGAGLGIRHINSNTKAAFEIAAGVQLPVKGPHAVRVGVKFLFSNPTTTLLLGSYSF
jgi:opacity protein-like surface antigen